MPRTAAAIFAVLTACLWCSPALCAVGRTRQQLNYRPIIGKIWSHERLYLVSTGPRRSRLYTWIVEGSYVICCLERSRKGVLHGLGGEWGRGCLPCGLVYALLYWDIMFLIIDFWLSSQDVCFVFIAMVQYLGKKISASHIFIICCSFLSLMVLMLSITIRK